MRNLFHSAALKLTVWYLAVIMSLSVVCSGVIYHFSSQELELNTRRQVYFFNDQLSSTDFFTFSKLRQRQLNDALQRLQFNLVLFNLGVIAFGGVASYGLARRTMRPIEETLEAQTRFAGDASHELRTPLAVMQTEIEVALRNPNLSSGEAIKILSSNLEETTKLRALSDGLLRLSSTDNLQELSQIVQLKSVAGQAVQQWSKIAQRKKIKITTQLLNVKTHGDPQSLVDLVSILLDNAIKFSPAGSEIVVRSYKKDRRVHISVQDNGLGIAKEELPQIFERFYQGDTSRSKKSASGYGLGLAIAKKIVELHRGSIEVKSTVGKGSTFIVHLPGL